MDFRKILQKEYIINDNYINIITNIMGKIINLNCEQIGIIIMIIRVAQKKFAVEKFLYIQMGLMKYFKVKTNAKY